MWSDKAGALDTAAVAAADDDSGAFMIALAVAAARELLGSGNNTVSRRSCVHGTVTRSRYADLEEEEEEVVMGNGGARCDCTSSATRR